MIDTDLKIKTGRDFADFFYSVPEELLPTKREGKAVEKITIEVCVEDLLFFRKELRFCGSDPCGHFGYVVIPRLGEGEYTFRITENLVRISKDRFVRDPAGTNVTVGTFSVSESRTANQAGVSSVETGPGLCLVH